MTDKIMICYGSKTLHVFVTPSPEYMPLWWVEAPTFHVEGTPPVECPELSTVTDLPVWIWTALDTITSSGLYIRTALRARQLEIYRLREELSRGPVT